MSEQNAQPSRANRFARRVFGVRAPKVIQLKEPAILPEQSEVVAFSVKLKAADRVLAVKPIEEPRQLEVNVFGWQNLEVYGFGVATINLPLSQEFCIEDQLLLNVPGRYQLASSPLLKHPQTISVSFEFSRPGVIDLTARVLKVWSGGEIKDVIHFLLGQADPHLTPPALFDINDNLWLEASLAKQPDFKFVLINPRDYTSDIIHNWPDQENEDLIQLLGDEESSSPSKPDQHEFPETLWLSKTSVLSIDDGETQLTPPDKYEFEKNLWLEAVEAKDIDLVIPVPGIEDLTLQSLVDETTITTLDMFEFIVKGNVEGKSYSQQFQEEVTTIVSSDAPDNDLELCKHGLIKPTCSLCNPQEIIPKKEKPSGKKSSIPPVLNVFDLLLPYLQPPLDKNFDNTLLFPPGKSLYDFQITGSYFLATNQSVLLADEMGLGKSIQAITAMRILFRRSRKFISVLIVCPKSVVKDWEKKLEEWAPELRVLTISGLPQLRSTLWHVPGHVYLVSYDTLAMDIRKLDRNQFTLVILDEIQAIKSPRTKRTKAVRQIQTEWRWGLSATPLENKAEDLVSIFAYLKPGLVTVFDAKNPARLKQRIREHLLRRRIKDLRQDIDLKDRILDERWLELTREQRETYDRILMQARNSLRPLARQYGSGNDRASYEFETKRQVLAQITELKKVCNFDPETGRSCKADFLKERLVDICETGEKVLIFSQYPNISLKPLAKTLKQFNPDLFDGSLSHTARDKKIREFQESDITQVLLMSVKAGGGGITLTRANHVFFLDQWWNPAIGEQAIGRAYRIGQNRTVFVTNFCVANTIEEKIREILQRKKQLFNEIIDDQSDQVYDSITTEELFELLDLVKFDAVLKVPGSEIGNVIKIVSEITGLAYPEARELVQRFPSTILRDVSRREVEQAKIKLETSGSVVEIVSQYEDD